jgi:hypothetical protein
MEYGIGRGDFGSGSFESIATDFASILLVPTLSLLGKRTAIFSN